MSKFTSEMVDEYANKLLIGLSKEENQMVLSEFDIIDKQCDLVTKIPNIQDVEPMTHCLDDFVVELREDILEEEIPIDELLKNSDRVSGREIELPKVVG